LDLNKSFFFFARVMNPPRCFGITSTIIIGMSYLAKFTALL